jgi:uncharacterized protein
MEFTNEFTIPLGIDEAFMVLTDLERVAPCMPGATLEEVDGASYRGKVKVKVGPMSLTYDGTATVTEVDEAAKVARIEASGREKRGAGTASADVRAALVEQGAETLVSVTTDINITGKPAQFGRGVMADVGAKIIERFAVNLQEELAAGTSAPTPAQAPLAEEVSAEVPTAVGQVSGPRRVEPRAPRDEALDLMEVAGGATAKRLIPVLVAAVVVILLIWRPWRR